MKTLSFFLSGVCAFAVSIDALWRIIESLTLLQFSVSGGALVAVCAAAPFVMKPTDTDINDVGLASFEDDENDAAPEHGVGAARAA